MKPFGRERVRTSSELADLMPCLLMGAGAHIVGINTEDIEHGRQGKYQLLPPAPPYYPFPEETSILGVIYGVLLWADMNAATPLGAWGRSVISVVRAAAMLAWLGKDLEDANTEAARAVRPWVVVHFHRPAYSTGNTDSVPYKAPLLCPPNKEPTTTAPLPSKRFNL